MARKINYTGDWLLTFSNAIRTETVLGPKQGLKLSSVVFGIDENISEYVLEIREETTTRKSHISSM
jgi:hypothetical protein